MDGEIHPYDLAVAHGLGDLRRLDARKRLLHVGHIFLHRRTVHISQHRRQPLRKGLGWNDENLLFREVVRLLRRQHDILVVRQHDDLLRGRRLNRFADVLCAGVHGLSAGDQLIDIVVFKDRPETVARADRDDCDRLFFLLGRGLLTKPRDGIVLFLHVLDLDARKLTELQGIGKCLIGRIGMYMHLDECRVAHDHQAVADL